MEFVKTDEELWELGNTITAYCGRDTKDHFKIEEITVVNKNSATQKNEKIKTLQLVVR